eukprot:TRINITY_DN6856_c0_g1_i1.p1 TRINITY_DN6856_c0_g1~~TRINITY_DN6856_c0_g1_i1.p1  ORF type:complete len:333 (-),score=68.70 TRINITY_DN6856_c0_g1_i1:21-1019(-)
MMLHRASVFQRGLLRSFPRALPPLRGRPAANCAPLPLLSRTAKARNRNTRLHGCPRTFSSSFGRCASDREDNKSNRATAKRPKSAASDSLERLLDRCTDDVSAGTVGNDVDEDLLAVIDSIGLEDPDEPIDVYVDGAREPVADEARMECTWESMDKQTPPNPLMVEKDHSKWKPRSSLLSEPSADEKRKEVQAARDGLTDDEVSALIEGVIKLGNEGDGYQMDLVLANLEKKRGVQIHTMSKDLLAAFITAYGRAGRNDRALFLVDYMHEHGEVDYSEVTYGALYHQFEGSTRAKTPVKNAKKKKKKLKEKKRREMKTAEIEESNGAGGHQK